MFDTFLIIVYSIWLVMFLVWLFGYERKNRIVLKEMFGQKQKAPSTLERIERVERCCQTLKEKYEELNIKKSLHYEKSRI